MRKFIALSSSIALVQAQENPVKKVVNLLTEMQTQMNEDAKADLAAFKKMDCYCNKEKDLKDGNVVAANNEIESSSSVIEAKTGEIAGAKQAVADREKEIEDAKKALKDAGALRVKESQEAAGAQKDMDDTIVALGKALEILGKVSGQSSFLQVEKTLNPFRASLNQDVFALLGKLDSAHKLQQGSSAGGFLQASSKQTPSDSSVPPQGLKRDYNKLEGPLASAEAADKTGGVAGIASYNAASGGIFGLLSQMKSDFENQLKNSIAEEKAKTKAFADLKAEKEADIALRKKQNTASKQQKAAAEIAKSDAQRALDEATMDLENSQSFLEELKIMCEDGVTGYDDRNKERSDELTAVGEAIKFLTSDEARESFNKAYSFIQLSSVHAVKSNISSSIKSQLAKVNMKSKKIKSLVLAQVNTALKSNSSASLNQFKNAKAALNQLKDQLAVEQDDERAARDQCLTDRRSNDVTTADATTAKDDADAAVADLDGKIELLDENIASKKATIDEENAAIKESTEDRKEEHAVLLKVVKDQEVVIEVLNMALSKLEGFYGALEGKKGASLLSVSPKPPKQQQYKRQDGGQGALGLLHVIVDDCKHVIKIAKQDDKKGQEDYEALLQQSNDNIETWNEQVVSLTGQKGRDEEERAEQETNSEAEAANLFAAGEDNAAIKKRCDFLVKNFETRQESRISEMESIDQAVAILSGADFGGGAEKKE